MLRGIYTAAHTMGMSFKKVDMTAQNISNAHTYGYKKRTYATHAFKDAMVQLEDGTEVPIATGMKLTDPGVDHRQGILKPTGNDLDVAIQGEKVFFQVERINPKTGETRREVTRNGHFTMNQDHELVTFSGAYVLDRSDSRIKIPDIPNSKVVIDRYGHIFMETNKARTEVTQFKFVPFKSAQSEDPLDIVELIRKYGITNPDDEDLDHIDPSDTSNLDVPQFQVKQGTLEESNVNLVTEMVMFMMSSKNYGMSEKIIQAEDKVLDKSINEMGRLS